MMETKTDSTDELLAHYADCPRLLGEVITGLLEDQLDWSESSESWTIRQIIHHLADGDDIWKSFIKRAVGNPQGVFRLDWYWQMPQEEWARAWHYAERAVEPSLALFQASRAHVVQLLRHIPGALDRCLLVCTPDGNEEKVSVAEIVAMQTRHGEGHIADIRRILALHRDREISGGSQ